MVSRSTLLIDELVVFFTSSNVVRVLLKLLIYCPARLLLFSFNLRIVESSEITATANSR